MGRLQNYEDFWLFYLKEHAQPATRYIHYVGTTIGLIFFLTAVILLKPWMILAGLVSGYFFAWLSHFLVEKNRPATFQYPLWSFYSDFRMYFLFVSGKLPPHLERAGIKASSSV